MNFAANARGDTSTVTERRCLEPQCPVRSGRLTPAAQNKARDIGRQLTDLALEEVYGSPGSADGPTYVAIVYRADGTASKHHLDPMEPDVLPPPLDEAADLIGAVSDALSRCESTALIEVGPECAEIERQDGDQPIGRP